MSGQTYVIGGYLGEGSFGRVYACKDNWGNALAAKVLKPIAPREKLLYSAVAERDNLLRLRHPFITYVHDAFEYRNQFWIVTERCWGPISTTLFAIQNFQGLGWVKPVARCVLQAVHYLHRNNYAHQDIHPGNVFSNFARDEMSPDNMVGLHFKLGDLGVARVVSEMDGKKTLAQWMLPPEAIDPQFGPFDRRVDIFHAALLLLQIAYSEMRTFTPAEMLDGVPRKMAEALPPPLGPALARALRRHAEVRTPNAMVLWQEING